jgi:peptidoglycan-associated lipoprotein
MKRIISILVIIAAMIAGCAQKNIVKSSDQPQKETAVAESRQAESREPAKWSVRDTCKSKNVSERDLSGKRSSETQKTIKDLETRFQNIYFDYDKHLINDNAKALLKKLSSAMLKNQRIRVLIEGHCDDRGTAEYNIALGDRRANAAKQYLSSLGIPAGRIETVSYGKEKPACTESNEECWAKNRRDHLVFE